MQSPVPNLADTVARAPTQSTVYQIEPLHDGRWDEFVSRTPSSSVFHTRAWLETLRRTYKYESIVLTTSPGGRAIENGLVLCRVASWLTGSRLVSLPFSDHCAVLSDDPVSTQLLVGAAERQVVDEDMDYLELRPTSALPVWNSLPRSEYSYRLHQLDLSPDLDTLFQGFHKSCIQRKISRAERERLRYEEGRSDSLMERFYRLLVMTRRRHHAPPQPREWFQNLADCFGDRLKIHLASSDARPAAAILTLRHKDGLVYKYGASDVRFHHLGPMHLVFWRCIQEAKADQVGVFDLGRSGPADVGLIAFKERWGSVRSTLTYSRYGNRGRFEYHLDGSRKEHIARDLVSRLPRPLFTAIGRWVYPHIG